MAKDVKEKGIFVYFADVIYGKMNLQKENLMV